MNTLKAAKQPEVPKIEYVVVGDELNVLNEVFNELFEQVEKELSA